MASTNTEVRRTIYGDARIAIWEYDYTDGGNVEHNPGFGHIDAAFIMPMSGCTFGMDVYINVLTAATASEGFAAITAIASGDKFRVIYHGR